MKRGPVVRQQWNIVLGRENQWWGSREYCEKTSGEAAENIIRRRPVVEQQGNCEKENSGGAAGNIVKRRPVVEQQGIL